MWLRCFVFNGFFVLHIWDAVACEQSETDAIADVACLCVGGTENCDAGKFCYDDTCNDEAKPK